MEEVHPPSVHIVDHPGEVPALVQALLLLDILVQKDDGAHQDSHALGSVCHNVDQGLEEEEEAVGVQCLLQNGVLRESKTGPDDDDDGEEEQEGESHTDAGVVAAAAPACGQEDIPAH